MNKFGFVSTLVLKEFEINENAADGPSLHMVGRPEGLRAWILSTMNLDPTTTVRMQGEEFSVVRTDLSGETHTVVPVSAIESTICGFKRELTFFVGAVIFLILAVLALFSGDFGITLLWLLAAGVGAALYYFSRSMVIAVTAGSHTEIIKYKKGVIDGVPVDMERSLKAIGVVNAAVLRKPVVS